MPIARTTPTYHHILEYAHALQQGIVVGIDPSIGSRSSQPGYAVAREGIIIESGILPINPNLTMWLRLQKLSYHIRKLYREWDPDVLVFEDIPSQRHGGGNANAHASLLKAVGVVLSISGPEGYIPMSPQSWKRMTRSTYVKSDEADAVEILWIAIEESKRIQTEEQTRRDKQQASKMRKKNSNMDITGITVDSLRRSGGN